MATTAESHATPAASAHGFTLLELLVVIVIMAVLAGAFTLAMGSAGPARKLEQEGERFRALVELACERALLTGREIGIAFTSSGYDFRSYEREIWKPLDKVGELRARVLPTGFASEFRRDGHVVALGDTPPEKPLALCYASGELTPFEYRLAVPGTEFGMAVTALPDGRVELKQRKP